MYIISIQISSKLWGNDFMCNSAMKLIDDGIMHKMHKWQEVNFSGGQFKNFLKHYDLRAWYICVLPLAGNMNHLALLSALADSLHMWVPIPVFNSFPLKMSLMHFMHDTIVRSRNCTRIICKLFNNQLYGGY